MPPVRYDATARQLRQFAALQVGLTGAFLVVLFVMLGDVGGDLPPWWVVLALLVAVAIGAALAERVWLTADPLDPAADPEEVREEAVSVFAGQTVRKLVYCEIPILLAVVTTFLLDAAAWPILVAGLPGLAVLAFEVWPSLRNATLTSAMLDAGGARSDLVRSFV
ncbi:hypothetical protein [Aeromicrobium marinum]|uniref:hypothetical protein n=1 Tax=Aeromicrobium marinum TaxID=219314 RepID=UPI0001BCD1FF|nr:hypothetical protein [Aeromicrobium marinum]